MSYALGIETLEQRAGRVAAATANQRDLARTLYAAGEDAFAAGSFDVAIRYYTDAWSTVPHPEVLLAIGAAMMRLRRFEEAALRFRRYLRENPDGPSRGLATRLLAEVQSAMEQRAAETRTPPPPRPPEVPAAKIERVSKTPAQVASSAPAPARDPYTPSTGPYWFAAGIATVGFAGLGWLWTRRQRRLKRRLKTNRRRRRR